MVSPVLLQKVFGYGAGNLLNIQPKGTVLIGSAPTTTSAGAVENWHLIPLPFKVEINELVLHFFLLFPIPPLCSLSPQSLPMNISGVWLSASDTELTASLSLSFFAPRHSAPQHISNPASELSGDAFGFTVYLWLSVGLSLFFWVFKYF